MGTKDGWHYIYPIHEAPVNDRTATQGKRALPDPVTWCSPSSQALPAEPPLRSHVWQCASACDLPAATCSCSHAATGQLITMRHVTEQFIGDAGHRSWVKSRRRVLRLPCVTPLSIPRHLCLWEFESQASAWMPDCTSRRIRQAYGAQMGELAAACGNTHVGEPAQS